MFSCLFPKIFKMFFFAKWNNSWLLKTIDYSSNNFHLSDLDLGDGSSSLYYLTGNTKPAGNYMFRVNNRNTRTRCEIGSKLAIQIPERHQVNAGWARILSSPLTLCLQFAFQWASLGKVQSVIKISS